VAEQCAVSIDAGMTSASAVSLRALNNPRNRIRIRNRQPVTQLDNDTASQQHG
jgi:hypothetical protein